MALLRRGLCGEPVRILQQQLGVDADGIFGRGTEAALIQYQTDNGLSPDGIAGPDTFSAMGLDELVLLQRPIRGNLVQRLQEALGIDADGIFGAGTEDAVRNFQEQNGLEATGQAGPETLALLPGFEAFQTKIEGSLITVDTPPIDPNAVEEARAADEAPPEKEGFIAHAVHSAEEVVANVGKSIWTTVRSIF
jgi:peptidoglycan hydrolase-like protein with peptidoglycan-binding domain